ncbi:2-Hydroxyacid oxidase 1-like [Diabrotica virgifera virgifera]|uniref:(S)-2-hydroxy-acid oxidase n=1 Tax=Diabrotica virgifera virgifera TaxID=50390 RepID=A0A6P7FSV0_DIAVI|nr:2-Hydroxyacid oxidase 1-like [Diabrotica virgifera virgifera]
MSNSASNLVCVNDYEEYAKEELKNGSFEFYNGGAGQQRTLEWNKTDFNKYRIRPKYMRNVSNRNLSTNILGKPVAVPIGISPSAYQKIAHPDGECATAKAAQESDTILILSSHSNCTFEEVAKAAPHGRKWLQLYIFQNREITKDFVKRAEKNGFEALVVTVDFALYGIHLGDLRSQFKTPPHLQSINFNQYTEGENAINFYEFTDPEVEWSYITWLKTITNLPIVVKGVLTGEDAIAAADAGASAILVSNHGGRQLDSLPSAIEALPEVSKAVGHRIELYMDGGIRDGTDVYKALGLGARMVFIGRPALWGLTHDGEKGVKNILDILKKELDNAMGITGCSKITDINKDRVVHESYYARQW